jgi:GNAT superfamily N-acetyltransferase
VAGNWWGEESNGELVVYLDTDDHADDNGRRAGTTRLFVLNADAAEKDDVDLCELLDRRSETAAFISLIGEEPGNFSAGVYRLLNEEVIFCRNLLLLDRLEILPEFRGQELGLKFMKAAITRFGLGCRLAVLKPFPLQFEGKMGTVPVGRSGQVVRRPPAARTAAAKLRSGTEKLMKYYARAGFVALSGSELMILDLEKRREFVPAGGSRL